VKYQNAIFDLDGVLVDTAKYHYLAWNKVAGRLGFSFTLQDNERLKGVSRMDSLKILLSIGGLSLTDEEMQRIAAEKNGYYLDYISRITPDELLVGAKEILAFFHKKGLNVSLGSASKNSLLILEKTGIAQDFDCIIDGNCVTKAKPDPQVFTQSADRMQISYGACIVFEDSVAGIQAAKSVGMLAVGIGDPQSLRQADKVFPDLLQAKQYFLHFLAD